MTYKRTFTRQQVHDLICESELRVPPTPQPPGPGHTLKYHSDMRTDIADRRAGRIIYLAETIEESRLMEPTTGISEFSNYAPGVDSRFTTRLDLVNALHEALNSPAGQNKLQEFDADPVQKKADFTYRLASPIGNVERYDRLTGQIARGLRASAVFVLLYRLSGPPECGLHLQTAYPKDVH